MLMKLDPIQTMPAQAKNYLQQSIYFSPLSDFTSGMNSGFQIEAILPAFRH